MSQTTNTFDTTNSNRNRETLADWIDMITPKETPLYSLLGSESVDGIHPEWNQDSLSSPSLANKRVQGDNYDFDAITPTKRVGNHTQIMMKEFIVAETQEAVAKAGEKSDYDREMLKKGVELRTDIEVTLASNQASVAYSGNTPAQMAGLRAWIATNDSMGSGGASGGFNTTTKLVDAATNGTQRTFTKTIMDNSIEDAYRAGGSPTILMLSPYLKRSFSGFMADSAVAQFRKEAKSGQQRIIAAADEYQSDFGMITVMPNRQWARVDADLGVATLTRTALLIEPGKAKVGFLRKIQRDKDVAKTGDAKPGVLKCEVTSIVKNEAALAAICDLYGQTASS